MYKITAILILLLSSNIAFSNNIQVENISLTGQNTADGYTLLQFDLSWENSWRISVGPSNWDAAWVFAKYRVNGNNWNHATLNLTGGSTPAGTTIEVVSDQTGAFIYRDTDGTGDISLADIQLRWNYAADGVDDNALVDIQIFAIEMVYVPEGSFYLGTGTLNGSEIAEFYTPGIFGAGFSYEVTSENEITIGTGNGELYYNNNTGSPGDQLGPIPASFPKGYAAFYCMKYETSQDQWISFFNSLTQTQKEALDVTSLEGKNSDIVVSRNAISWPDAGNATTTLPNVPLNYVRNGFLLAYLDWAGLRLMTELEFEKACRGPLNPVGDEYAWGTSNIHASDYTLINEDTDSEQISNPGSGVGNCCYSLVSPPSGPYRCGIFAASALLNNREETGGSYYGIMELSGNVYERAVSVGNPQGRSFTGEHGDGAISADGSNNVANWPIAEGDGFSFRVGSHFNEAQFITVSDRNDAASSFSGNNNRIGFRGVRTAQ